LIKRYGNLLKSTNKKTREKEKEGVRIFDHTEEIAVTVYHRCFGHGVMTAITGNLSALSLHGTQPNHAGSSFFSAADNPSQ